ncbi:hypothetical protein C0Q70_08087 [Pomacea canaliculata]|uniref:Uridylate-specific endoribonuclease n=1 Tax=Pomacea canaliculata TaxID=400727 RepID=A0A2T7PGU4_POMCA|nr:hypothetical protein C0Q70_08087 [Pomacea canaliculata]
MNHVCSNRQGKRASGPCRVKSYLLRELLITVAVATATPLDDDTSSLCSARRRQDASGLRSDVSITCTSSINDVTEALWDSDVNRLRSDQYTLNLQSRASSSAREDRASSPLFTYVDPAVLTRPTFKAFVALQDNYDPTPHADDRLSTSDVNEADAFLPRGSTDKGHAHPAEVPHVQK